MRLAVRLAMAGPGVLLVTACATGTSETTGDALDRACTVSECFYERDVRDFEVIGGTTLVVYVGSQRCPFQVELDGTFCDLRMAPDLFFRSSRRGIDEERTYASNRICSYDRVGVDGGVFTESPGQGQPDGFGGTTSQCRVRNVTSLTDDQLMELYVARGVVAPPPPIGPGRIEVSGEGGEAPADSAAPAPEGAEPTDAAEDAPRASAAGASAASGDRS